MRVTERFERYVKIETTSDENSATVPSTAIQLDLARVLEAELKEMGVPKVLLNEYGIVYGWLPATAGYDHVPPLGLIAHMDTAPDASGKNVQVCYHPNYDGENVRLNEHMILSTKTFPHLKELKGKTLITTDGTTLLGADDKAGVAEIMTAVAEIIEENRPHGPLCIAFTPDEEVGCGADHFDVSLFGADYAYTVDGGPENEISWENFNAASADIKIHGVSVHPGEALDVMVNAVLVGCELNQMLPGGAIPRHTSGYEGFYHLTEMSGDVSEARMNYIIRDHSKEKFNEKKAKLEAAAAALNQKYGQGTVEISIKDSYYNMREVLNSHMHLVENARKVMENLGMTPEIIPTRGGTDGARLSFEGLPCPNLGTGGYAYHGPYEHITVEGLEMGVRVIRGLIDIYAGH